MSGSRFHFYLKMPNKKKSKPVAAVNSARSKAPLQYAITPEFEQEIREYVDQVNAKTGLPRTRIVTNLLLESVRRAKKFYPYDSENSETTAKNA